MKITYGWSLMLVVVFAVLYFRYLDAKDDGRLDEGIDPPWLRKVVPGTPSKPEAPAIS
jgi:arabinofuranan 3-O-arabinosyltransferase